MRCSSTLSNLLLLLPAASAFITPPAGTFTGSARAVRPSSLREQQQVRPAGVGALSATNTGGFFDFVSAVADVFTPKDAGVRRRQRQHGGKGGG